jgi:predicted small lipoprotein YifL
MGIEQKILVRASALGGRVATCMCTVVLLSACGQKGALYMPNDPEFKQRATLPEIVRRQLPDLPGTANPPAAPPAASPASSPATAASAPAGR